MVASDLVHATGLKQEAVAALIGSLKEKNVIYLDETQVNDDEYTFIHLEEAFYHLHTNPAWDEERVWQNEQRAKQEDPARRLQVEQAPVEFEEKAS